MINNVSEKLSYGRPVLTARHINHPDLKKQWILPDGPVLVGRLSKSETTEQAPASSLSEESGSGPVKLSIDFAPTMSRKHFMARWKNGRLCVRRIKTSGSPVFFRGNAADEFEALPGEVFTAGEVKFYVELREAPIPAGEPEPFQQLTLTWNNLQEARERNARRCLDAVLRIHEILGGDFSVQDFLRKNLDVIRQILSLREEIMVLKINPRPEDTSDDSYIEIYEGAVACLEHSCAYPSRRLVRKALETGQAEVYQWQVEEGSTDFTMVPGLRWACCCPVDTGVGNDERYVFYLMGFDPVADPDRIAVVQLVSEVASQYLRASSAMKLNYQVGQFFSPSIREILFSSQGQELLRPKITPIVSLFFDLRGFSMATEKAESSRPDKTERDRNISQYYKTLSSVLSGVTECVFNEGGTIIDYQGDAIIACWGAPQPQKDMAARAARAAIEIVKSVYKLELPFGKMLKCGGLMKCGVGISAGDALEGCLNAGEQFKYSLIGSVMNVASRLEGITKFVGVPILVTGKFIDHLKREQIDSSDDKNNEKSRILYRRIGNVQPVGMTNTVNLHEIVVEKESGGSGVDPGKIALYEKALDYFEKCRLDEALEIVAGLYPDDPVSLFLKDRIEEIRGTADHEKFDGTIKFSAK